MDQIYCHRAPPRSNLGWVRDAESRDILRSAHQGPDPGLLPAVPGFRSTVTVVSSYLTSLTLSMLRSTAYGSDFCPAQSYQSNAKWNWMIWLGSGVARGWPPRRATRPSRWRSQRDPPGLHADVAAHGGHWRLLSARPHTGMRARDPARFGPTGAPPRERPLATRRRPGPGPGRGGAAAARRSRDAR